MTTNIRETNDFAYCAYCSTVVGKVDDDCIMFHRIPVIPYFHDTLLRNCGLYHNRTMKNHAHYYEITMRPILNMSLTNRLVVRVLDSRKYGSGTICSSFEDRRLYGNKEVYKRYEECEPDSVTKGLVLAPSITSNMVIIPLFCLN